MKLYLVLLMLVISSCGSPCSKSTSYKQLQRLFDIPDSLVNRSYDRDTKNLVLKELCPLIHSNEKVSMIEEWDEFTGIYRGIVYLSQDSSFYYFHRLPSKKMTFEKKSRDSSFSSLRKVLVYAARDFERNGEIIEKYFDSIPINDPSIVKVYYVEDAEKAGVIKLPFSSHIDFPAEFK